MAHYIEVLESHVLPWIEEQYGDPDIAWVWQQDGVSLIEVLNRPCVHQVGSVEACATIMTSVP